MTEDGAEDESDKDNRHVISDLIEDIGYGPYHWKVIVAMGMMSFSDSTEIWIISLITYEIVCEWGISSLEEALIPGLVFLGMAIGSFSSGIWSDKYGRKKVMVIVYYCFAVFAIASAFAWSYISFLVLRVCVGFCIGANYGISICYSAEMVPLARRGFNLLLLDLIWAFGGVYICMCAFFLMEYRGGWRWVIIMAAAPCIISIPVLHYCDESVRYLMMKGRNDEALEIMQKMAQKNEKPPIEGSLKPVNSFVAKWNDIFKQPYTRRSLLIIIIFGSIVWVFYGFLYLLPDMMSYGYCDLSQFFDVTYVDENGCTEYTKSEFIFLAVVNILYIPGYIISPITAEYWGRRPTLWYSFWGGLIFTALMLICFGAVVLYIELFIVVNMYAIAIATVWLYTPECYPTYLRSTATGTHNGFSKIGAAAGTFLTEYIDSFNLKLSIIIFCVVLLISSIATLFLQHETMGMSLRDDVDVDPVRTPSEEEKGIELEGRQQYGTSPTMTRRSTSVN